MSYISSNNINTNMMIGIYITIEIMNLNFIALLTFLLVLVVFFWVMDNKSAKRVTTSLTSLLQVLPISKVINAIVLYFNSKK
jgi:hypothetical protein